MSIRVQDRLGAIGDARNGVALLGRFVVVRDAHVELFMNSLAVQDQAFLVPEPGGRWNLLCGSERLQGIVPRAQMLDPLDASSIRSIGQTLTDLIDRNGTWIDALGVSPLVPGMSSRSELQRFEQILMMGVGHLEEICRRPRTHLRVDVERLPVSRARRFPPQAGNFLAAHTEDWARPTLRSVVPKRILATVREDLVDIYENRVAARLVDNLTVYLGKRVHEVTRLLRVFDEATGNHGTAAGGSHWRQKRIYKLWSEGIDASDAKRNAERTLQQLKHLMYKIAGLKDSVLYREVPRRSTVSTTLTMTNILSDDAHYRRVAEIWIEWAKLGRIQSIRPSAFFAEMQHLCQSFNQFALLLTIRALEQLGFEPTDIERSLSSHEVELCHGSKILRLSWGLADGLIQIQGDWIESLRIVPLCSSLAALDDEQIRQLIDDVDTHAASEATTVVLYPTPDDEIAFGRLDPSLAVRLRSLAHEVGQATRRRVGFMPVSPWDIGSVERMARQLRWVATARTFAMYPPTICRAVAAEIGNKWGWIDGSGERLCVVRSPAEHEHIPVADIIQNASEEIGILEHEREDVDSKLRQAVRDRGNTGTLNARKRELNVKISDGKERLDVLHRLEGELAMSIAFVKDLLECPTCRRNADPRRDFQPKGRSFSCTCSECGTFWGTIACGCCSRPIPVLRLHGLESSNFSREPAWVDRMLGADCLSIPRIVASGIQFDCPHCGPAAVRLESD